MEETMGDLCDKREDAETVESLIPCGKREGESRMLFIGDSLVRDLFVTFLELLDIPLSWDWDEYKGHRSFDVVVRKGKSRRAVVSLSSPSLSKEETPPLHWRVPEVEEAIVELPEVPCNGITLSFRWAPFVRNVTRVFGREEIRGTSLLLDSGLWDLLHIHSEATLKRDITELSSLLVHMWGRSKIVIWLSPGRMETTGMLTEEKKRYLTDDTVDGLNRVTTEVFAVSPVRMHRIDLRYTMDFAESIKSPHSLTIDGVHPPQELLRSVVPTLLGHWNEVAESKILDKPIRLLPIGRERMVVSDTQPPTKSPGFIGADPFLGALVGLYFVLTFLTGDILIFSRPILWILGA